MCDLINLCTYVKLKELHIVRESVKYVTYRILFYTYVAQRQLDKCKNIAFACILHVPMCNEAKMIVLLTWPA